MTAVRSRRVLELCSEALFALGDKTMDNINYTTPDEQLKKLKSQNLIIDHEGAAIDALSAFGYSNLIKSYRDPYTITVDGKKVYRSGITFKQIYSLYRLDKNLRNAVIAAMLDLEEHIKEQASNVIAESFGTHEDSYLNYKNYRNKRKRKEQFKLSSIIATMKKTLNTDKDPIHHYKTEHGIVPPWILFKSIYFSTIINFIDQFKVDERNQMVHRLYTLSSLGINEEQGRMLMMDTLYLASDYRNLAAHGGRVYNHVSDNVVRFDEIFKGQGQPLSKGFNQFISSLQLLDYKGPFHHLQKVLTDEVNRHCSEFPQDVTYLGQTLNMDIIQQRIVYVTDSGDKYHNDPHCSGMKDSYALEYEEAQSKGYVPCKRCNK